MAGEIPEQQEGAGKVAVAVAVAGELPKKQDSVGKVKVISTCNVKPRKAVGRQECQLVTFDLPYLAFYYNQKLLVYKGVDHFEKAVEELKESLSIVLEDFHQLAGRLGKDDGVFRVEYDDDMDGVEVVVAAAEDIAVADLTDEEGSVKFKELVPCNNILNLEGLHRPLLFLQLTKLKDGLSMGCAFNHAVLDGTSTWHFMNSWAHICSGSTSISVPFLHRSKARNTRVQLNLSKPSDAPEHAKSAASNGDARVKTLTPPLREKVFRFSESAIDHIKSKVNAKLPSDGSKPFSTFQSLSTHMWHAVTRARQLRPEDHTVFTVFANCRKRVDPPMPESYFGNLIQAIFTVTAAGLLLANPPEFGANLIQKAIEMHNSKAIDERNKKWESNPKIFEFKDAGTNCVVVGSSPRFKVYDVDFGFGKPEVVRSGQNNRFDGMVYLYQGKSGGRSIDVEITLEANAMERLEKDKEFLLLEA